jgi:hypothetical protein
MKIRDEFTAVNFGVKMSNSVEEKARRKVISE